MKRPTYLRKDGKEVTLPKFQKKGEAKPIYVTNPVDPRLKAYNDSLNLYKAYEFQKNNTINRNYPQRIYDNVNLKPDSYKPIKNTNAEYKVLLEKKKKQEEQQQAAMSRGDYKHPSLRNPIDFSNLPLQTPIDLKEMKERESLSPTGLPLNYEQNRKIINYYRSIGIPDRNINFYNSPDVYHPTIKPIAEYNDGQAISPVYKKPVQPYIYKKEEPTEEEAKWTEPSKKGNNMWTKKDVTEESWKNFKKKYPDAIGMDPYHVDKDGKHAPIYAAVKKEKPVVKEEPVIIEKPEYMEMRQVSIPELSRLDYDINAKIKTPQGFVKQRFNPETRLYEPVYVESWNTPATMGKRIYNKNVPSSTGAPPADFVPQFEPNEQAVKKAKGGRVEKFQTKGIVLPSETIQSMVPAHLKNLPKSLKEAKQRQKDKLIGEDLAISETIKTGRVPENAPENVKLYYTIEPTGYLDERNAWRYAGSKARKPEKTSMYPADEDAWKKYLGLIDKSENILESKTRPSTETSSFSKYYKVNPKIEKELFYKIMGKLNNMKDTTIAASEFDLQEKQEGANPYSVFGNFRIGRGTDPKTKKPYVSYYDRYDFDTAPWFLQDQLELAGKPFEFYNRFYPPKLKDKSGKFLKYGDKEYLDAYYQKMLDEQYDEYQTKGNVQRQDRDATNIRGTQIRPLTKKELEFANLPKWKQDAIKEQSERAITEVRPTIKHSRPLTEPEKRESEAVMRKIENPWIYNPAGNIGSIAGNFRIMSPQEIVETHANPLSAIQYSLETFPSAALNIYTGADALGLVNAIPGALLRTGELAGNLGKLISKPKNPINTEPVFSPAYYEAQAKLEATRQKYLEELNKRINNAGEKKSLDDIAKDVDDFGKTIKPRSEVSTKDLESYLEQLKNINKEIEKNLGNQPKGKIEGIGSIDDVNKNPNIKEWRDPETGKIVYRLEKEDYNVGNDWETIAPTDFRNYVNDWINKYYSDKGGKYLYHDRNDFLKELNKIIYRNVYKNKDIGRKLTQEDFFTVPELEKMAEQQANYYKALEEFEKTNPIDPSQMIFGALTGDKSYMEKFKNLYPNVNQPDWYSKFYPNLEEFKILRENLPYQQQLKDKLSPRNLRLQGSGENKLLESAKPLRQSKDDWFYKASPRDYVMEMRNSLGLKPEQISKMSDEQLLRTAQKIFNKLKGQQKERYLKDVENPFTGSDAFQSLSPNKLGGSTQLSEKEKRRNNWLALKKEDDDVSYQGYRRTSRYKNRDSILINTDNGLIDMTETDFPIYAISNMGEERIMQPGTVEQFEGNQVLEIPMKHQVKGQVSPAPVYKGNPNDEQALRKWAEEYSTWEQANESALRQWAEQQIDNEMATSSMPTATTYAATPMTKKPVVENKEKLSVVKEKPQNNRTINKSIKESKVQKLKPVTKKFEGDTNDYFTVLKAVTNPDVIKGVVKQTIKNLLPEENVENVLINKPSLQIKEARESEKKDTIRPVALFNSEDLEKEILNRQKFDNSRYGEFDKRGDDVLNRTDIKRNRDSEAFFADMAENNSVIIDIGSALGNNNPKLAGVSVYELSSNPVIQQKNIKVIGTDIPSEIKGFEEHRKNKKAYNIDYAQVPMDFKTPVSKILKDKKLEDRKHVYLRAANSIDLLMTPDETKEHLAHIARTLRNKEVTYLYNNVILHKPYGQMFFEKLGNLNNAAFDHVKKSWLSKKERVPYQLLKSK